MSGHHSRGEFVAGLTALLAWPAVAARQPLRPGVSADAMKRLGEQAARAWAQRVGDLARRRSRAFAPLQELAVEHQPKLVAAFDKLPQARPIRDEYRRLAEEHQRVVTLTDAKAKAEATAKLRTAWATYLRRAEPVLQTAWRASGVDLEQLDSAGRRLLGRYSNQRYERLGPAAWRLVPADDRAVPLRTAYEFAPPYQVEIEDEETGGINVSGAYANKETGGATSLCFTEVAGGCEARAAVGVGVTVPRGYSRLSVAADFGQHHYNNGGSFLGAAGSGTGFLIEAYGPNDTTRSKEFETASNWVAVAWFYGTEHRGDRTKSVAFDIPDAGGEWLVYAGNYSWAWAGGPGGSVGDATDVVKAIRVEVSR